MIGSDLLKVFASSPIKPLQQHMECVHDCAATLHDFIAAALQQDWDLAKIHLDQIIKLECAADDLKRDIRLHLPNSLFMPIARGDLLSLLTIQDKIAGKAKHISSLIWSRRMLIPKEIASDYAAFMNRSIDASEQAKQAIAKLDSLVSSGFRGKTVEVISSIIMALDNLERDTDKMHIAIRNLIHKIEKTLDPIDVIFLYKIIDWTAELADRAQHVGYRLESLLAQ
ncbi:MAG: TIGR00153 family protein [Legionellales bacterium]|nr:MAG: TIGR00153 family protein [Legionellales bacterium]